MHTFSLPSACQNWVHSYCCCWVDCCQGSPLCQIPSHHFPRGRWQKESVARLSSSARSGFAGLENFGGLNSLPVPFLPSLRHYLTPALTWLRFTGHRCSISIVFVTFFLYFVTNPPPSFAKTGIVLISRTHTRSETEKRTSAATYWQCRIFLAGMCRHLA